MPSDRCHHGRRRKATGIRRLRLVVDPAQPRLLELAAEELEPPTRGLGDLLV